MIWPYLGLRGSNCDPNRTFLRTAPTFCRIHTLVFVSVELAFYTHVAEHRPPQKRARWLGEKQNYRVCAHCRLIRTHRDRVPKLEPYGFPHLKTFEILRGKICSTR